jgi:hypothetical protein
MGDPFSLGADQVIIISYPLFVVIGATGCSGGIA